MSENEQNDFIDCIYWGIFFGHNQIPEPSLENAIEYPHITFAFKQPAPLELIGSSCEVQYVGYGDDGQNQAVEVKLPDWAYEYYAGANTAHITISVAQGAKPVDSANLDFEPIDAAYEATETGTFGFFGWDEQVHLERP